jgi:hypothetical protein
VKRFTLAHVQKFLLYPYYLHVAANDNGYSDQFFWEWVRQC